MDDAGGPEGFVANLNNGPRGRVMGEVIYLHKSDAIERAIMEHGCEVWVADPELKVFDLYSPHGSLPGDRAAVPAVIVLKIGGGWKCCSVEPEEFRELERELGALVRDGRALAEVVEAAKSLLEWADANKPHGYRSHMQSLRRAIDAYDSAVAETPQEEERLDG